MRQFAILGVVAARIGIASTNASAQEVGIYVGPSYGYGYEQDRYYGSTYRYYGSAYRYGPRVRYGQRVYEYSRPTDDRFEPELGTTDYWADRDSNRN
jgi:hypothetical protein